MSNGDLDKSYNLSWEVTFESNFDKIKEQIKHKIWQLNLIELCSIAQVRNGVFLIVNNQISSGKLRYQFFGNGVFFLKVKSDQTIEPILNFKAWLRTVSFNYLRQIRTKQNKYDKVLNIDYCYNLCDKKNPEKYIIQVEVREKLSELEDEDRRILEMKYFEGLNYKKISLSLQSEGFPRYKVANIRKKKERAEEKLRKLYQQK